MDRFEGMMLLLEFLIQKSTNILVLNYIEQ